MGYYETVKNNGAGIYVQLWNDLQNTLFGGKKQGM